MTVIGRRSLIQSLAALPLVCRGSLLAHAQATHRKLGPRPGSASNFHAVYDNVELRDRFFLFLQNVYHLYPEDQLHQLIIDACDRRRTDREVYLELQANLGEVRPAFAGLRYAIPALARQKNEMAREAVTLLGARRKVDGYVEIGTPGRYVHGLRDCLDLKGQVFLVHSSRPSYSPEDIVERGQLTQVGQHVPLADYAPIDRNGIPKSSVDLVSNFIGFHHAPSERLDGFVRSIWRVLRPKGILLVRDHDVHSQSMWSLVALAHDVFNAGLEVPWSKNAAEVRNFSSLGGLEAYLYEMGFQKTTRTVYQPHDPTRNALLAFSKRS